LNRSRPHKDWLSLTFAVATFALGCHPAVDTPGVPLYPNGATTRLPRNQIAQVAGPIAKIDGQDVSEQGGVFDVLPGCHVVVLDTRPSADAYSLSSGMYWSGQYDATIYAFRTKPGARYVIRRDLQTQGSGQGRVVLSAREEEPGGLVTDLFPATSADDIKACKQ
jgi:hypothetical protein